MENAKQTKEAVQDYLYSKYLAEEEQSNKRPGSKTHVIKSLLGDKKNKDLISSNKPIEDIRNEIENQFKKATKISEAVQNYPHTPIGNCLRNNKEKYDKLKRKEINANEYEKSLSTSIIEAINISADVRFSRFKFFPRISLELLKRIYLKNGFNIFADEVTDGCGDMGIDAVFCAQDKRKFLETVAIQTKARLNEAAETGDKVIREFLGSLHVANASTGVFVSTSEIYKDAKEMTEKLRHFRFIGKKELIALMKEHQVGLIFDGEKIARLDEKEFKELLETPSV